jgi:hypothetical protein
MKRMMVLLAFVGISMSAMGQGQSPDAKSVQTFVEGFLLRLGDHQYDTLDADFTPNALIVVTRQRGNQWENSYQPAVAWLAGLKKNANPVTFREPISNIQITIDSAQLAFLRADFQVVRDGKAQSKGVDQFTLVREPSGWKIAMVAYTSMPVN